MNILWVDDEIDLLRAQILFLENKGHRVTTHSNGYDAVDDFMASPGEYEVVFLDESMPGMSGLETLKKLKDIDPLVEAVMITKNEAEDVMEQAIGSQISDYLIKPVNPNQILLTLKKIFQHRKLVRQTTTTDYQHEFTKIHMEINSGLDEQGWFEIYRKIIRWELKLAESDSKDLSDILQDQKKEANQAFAKFIEKNYASWLKEGTGPTLSHQLFEKRILPSLEKKVPTVMVLLDNFRLDQWKFVKPLFKEYFNITSEEHFFSILPTATQYSRNAIFAGMTPLDIYRRDKSKWVFDFENKGKNLQEAELLEDQIARKIKAPFRHRFIKVVKGDFAKKLPESVNNMLINDLTVVVYNFIDMLSHARTEMEVLKELAGDEKAYRSLTKSWLLNSPLWELFQLLSEKDVNVVLTTDHGMIRAKTPIKIQGDKDTTSNLRYKEGRDLKYNKKDVFEVSRPEECGLPSPNLSSKYVFSKGDGFFVYPQNQNRFVNLYSGSFQHGGISLEEMIIPLVFMKGKS